MSGGNLYEVRCDNCDVSFPPGTKRCLHCKERLSGRLRQAPPVVTMRGQAGSPSGDPAASLEEFPGRRHLLSRELSDLPESGSASPDEREGSPVRTALRLGVNALWILGAIVITALQMCRGG